MREGALPIVLDLPMPPSVNAIWRSRRSLEPGKKTQYYLAHEYKAWKAHCDQLYMAVVPKPKKIVGPFIAAITLSSMKRKGDADNRTKAVMDLLQRWELIENDSLAERVTIGWGEAPLGCRVQVIPVIPIVKAEAA